MLNTGYEEKLAELNHLRRSGSNRADGSSLRQENVLNHVDLPVPKPRIRVNLMRKNTARHEDPTPLRCGVSGSVPEKLTIQLIEDATGLPVEFSRCSPATRCWWDRNEGLTDLTTSGGSLLKLSVRLHGASPWHLIGMWCSAVGAKREAPRGKPVASIGLHA